MTLTAPVKWQKDLFHCYPKIETSLYDPTMSRYQHLIAYFPTNIILKYLLKFYSLIWNPQIILFTKNVTYDSVAISI